MSETRCRGVHDLGGVPLIVIWGLTVKYARLGDEACFGVEVQVAPVARELLYCFGIPGRDADEMEVSSGDAEDSGQ